MFGKTTTNQSPPLVGIDTGRIGGATTRVLKISQRVARRLARKESRLIQYREADLS